MSYKTLAVEIQDGRVIARESLPISALALLTILDSDAPAPSSTTPTSLADLVRDTAGIGKGRHTDLSTARAHLDDLGR